MNIRTTISYLRWQAAIRLFGAIVRADRLLAPGLLRGVWLSASCLEARTHQAWDQRNEAAAVASEWPGELDEPQDAHSLSCALWTSPDPTDGCTCRGDGHTDRSFEDGVDTLVARFESYAPVCGLGDGS